jgi:fructose-1,6-bisphosphatase I
VGQGVSETRITLRQHIAAQVENRPDRPQELVAILGQIEDAGRRLAAEVRRLHLGEYGGRAGSTNVQGEDTKKLDLFGDQCFADVFRERHVVAHLVSEEQEHVQTFPNVAPGGRGFTVCIDPIDGSSNVDVNGIVGTIFSVREGLPPPRFGQQLAAGYVIYGPATMLVATVGNGVHGYTLDPASGEFTLSDERIVLPARGKVFSANVARSRSWPDYIRRLMDVLLYERDYSLRYSGSMVADLHRTLFEGGVFAYPPEESRPDGKLRFYYEVAPMAMLFEQAQGAATDGQQRILEALPANIHQRSPIVIGSKEEVELCATFARQDTQKPATRTSKNEIEGSVS